ncbi:unnamed protein product [Allacma fusca]|uniref:Saposin B-type domain-containing protein n=1 Tax=Allacma fusca TaxID=39272 RepID=A0A8J2NZP2_9HEXA|nr:unnamed protein product [Allacma fusca]
MDFALEFLQSIIPNILTNWSAPIEERVWTNVYANECTFINSATFREALRGWANNATKDSSFLSRAFKDSTRNWMSNDFISSNINSAPVWLGLPMMLRPLEHVLKHGSESARSVAACETCKIGIGLAMDYVREANSSDSLLHFAESTCKWFRLLDKDMCKGVVREFGPTLAHLALHTNLTSDQLCGAALQSTGCTSSDPPQWDVLDRGAYETFLKVPLPTPVTSTEARKETESSRRLKILHLTDVHMDPHYKPGSEANCKKEVCCRGPLVSTEAQAGFYGDYRYCDLPYHTFESSLAHIAQTHQDLSMIYLTGDLVPHTGLGWVTEREEVEDIIRNVSNTISRYFPKIPIIPVLGNHDTLPMNQFSSPGAPPEVSTDWVYSTAASAWSKWLSRRALKSFRKAGYYSRVVHSRLRIIVLNTNFCFTSNFWQLNDGKDPGGQLQWLADQLQEAEDAGQRVHILGHIPPNFEACLNVWSRNFYEIITRYNSVIAAQFYGHTHHDDFSLYYHPVERNRPISSFWVGASLTPYIELNPGYKIFIAEGGRKSEFNILDHETWIFNLTEANLSPNRPPEWFRLYSAKEAYALENLSLEALHGFVERMARNQTAFDVFNLHFYKAADVQGNKACDSACRKRMLCNIVSPYYNKYVECVLTESREENVLPESIFLPSNSTQTEVNPYSQWSVPRVMGAKTKSYMSRKGRF